MERFQFACPCNFGLEGVLSGELKRLGMEEVTAADGRVDFSGTAADLCRANHGGAGAGGVGELSGHLLFPAL